MSTLIELLSVVTVLALVTPGLIEFDKILERHRNAP